METQEGLHTHALMSELNTEHCALENSVKLDRADSAQVSQSVMLTSACKQMSVTLSSTFVRL